MKKLLILFLLLCSINGFSQDISRVESLKKIDQVTTTVIMPFIQELYHGKMSNSEEYKEKISSSLSQAFETVLNMPYSFDYAFDSLTTNHPDIGILVSPDNKFRIIHWNITKEDGTFQYFGFIQSKHTDVKKTSAFHKTKTTTVQLYPLIDKSAEIRNPENAITDNKKWYGALYYKIIHTSSKKKDYYTLLGWDGNDKFSQKKIIDVLTFDNNGVPHFGADIFNFQKKFPKRVIFEYSATCNMSLKYSTTKDSIVFGHLAPIEPQLEGQYQYYCSDMSCDGFGFKKGKWNYGADVNAVNDKDEKDKLYHDPRKLMPGNESNTIITRPRKKKKDK